METKIQDYFSNVADPRQTRKCSHLLSDILLIGLCTYLSNGEDYEDMVLFGQTKASLLPAFFSLPNGVPSHDTFNRVFQLIEPKFLQQCLQDFGKDMVDILAEKQICIDGKKLKGGSPKSRANQGLYLVNGWSGTVESASKKLRWLESMVFFHRQCLQFRLSLCLQP